MVLERLRLRDFRNYATLDVGWSPGLNLIVGPNAAGKTNLLEAVYVLATGRSHRGARDPELVRWGADGYAVHGRAQRSAGPLDAEVRYGGTPPGKDVLLNGAPQERVIDLLGRIQAVCFAPEDLGIIKGPPGRRRRFFDTLLAQAYPRYRDGLLRYAQVHARRNAALRDLAGRRLNPELLGLLEVWDAQLADAAGPLWARRATATRTLDGLAAEAHEVLAGPGPGLRLEHLPAVDRPAAGRVPTQGGWGGDPAGERGSGEAPNRRDVEGPAEARAARFTRRYREALARDPRDDIRRGATPVGPHRDEWRVSLDGVDLRSYGSQGQHRTAALALKLAERAFLEAVSGEPPVLLLDDVLSELDPERRERLLSLAAGTHQTLLTAAVADGLPGGAGVARYWVEGGRVRCDGGSPRGSGSAG